jgi:hypothetical protein
MCCVIAPVAPITTIVTMTDLEETGNTRRMIPI